MFTYNTKTVKASVRTLDNADKRNAKHQFVLGTVHLTDAGKNDKGKPMTAAQVADKFGTGSTSATSDSALGRYRLLGGFAKPYVDEQDDWEEIVKVIYVQGLSLLARPKHTAKKNDLRDIFENAAIMVNEGSSRLEAIRDSLTMWDEAVKHGTPVVESGDGADTEPDNGGDVSAAGDTGDMSVTEALTAAVRLLEIAAGGITPTEVSLHSGLIERAFDLASEMFATSMQEG